MSEQCPNYPVKLGCQRAFGGEVCPKVKVKRIWAGDPGVSDSIPKEVTCGLTGRKLEEGVNIERIPPPDSISSHR